MERKMVVEYVGKKIKEYRLIAGMTQKELGEKLGVKHNTISSYESGKNEADMDTIFMIAKALNVRVDDIFPNTEKSTNISTKFKKIPVLGTIAAGQPIYAFENIEDYEYLPEDCNIDFCLKVKGDSMIGARIFDGDIVFIRKQPSVENGEIAAVIVDGENATLKRVYKDSGTIILHAENPKYPNMIFTAKDKKQLTILGLVKCAKFEVI